ncbi:MAG TPA: nucleotide sugar dehydrogenase, partial [Burkholderiales bacterium]|nr:nucleotide sugar dehydrogenase [Burkholderiales bacterium]
AAAAAARGFTTLCFDPDSALIGRLNAGELPVVEPGLPELIAQNRQRMAFMSNGQDLARCAVCYIATDVPTDDTGTSDLAGIRALIENVCAQLSPQALLVVLCQVPPGFTRTLAWPKERLFYQVETLIFGRAVERATQPERFIIGCANPAAALPGDYHSFLESFGCPILPMRYESAELAKIAINCCLVSSVTVANTLAELSERIGANWHEIVPALKLDRRIGQYAYLAPGLGIAGGNLERDLATVLHLASDTGAEAGLIRSFVHNSRHRKDWVLRTLHRELLHANAEARIAILGLAYKENTHSIKNSASIGLIAHLQRWPLRLHDPVVSAANVDHPLKTACDTALEAARGADALVIMTPWPEYRSIDCTKLQEIMRGRLIIDPYRMLSAEEAARRGFDYVTLGMPPMRAGGRNGRHA